MRRFCLVAFLILSSTASAREFQCRYKGDATDEPYYGKNITLIIDDAKASLKGETSPGDQGGLDPSTGNSGRPRFMGFDNHADCASDNYLDVDRSVLSGQGGEIEFTGPGNEDCAPGDDTYICKG